MHDMTSVRAVTTRSRAVNWALDLYGRHRKWFLFVLLPTLLIAGYFYLISANQYESEAHFVVKTANEPSSAPSGIGEALSMVGAASSQSDAMVVSDYLTSHDAVAALQKRLNLVELYRRPESDIFSRLWTGQPTPETLFNYYLDHIDVKVHSDSGITVLKVRGFRPADSLAIIDALLKLGEERVNLMNQRNYQNAVSVAQIQENDAERNVADVQRGLTSFRMNGGDFNPQTTGTARVTLVSQLQGQLSNARAQEAAMSSAVGPNAPQLIAVRAKVTALQRQLSIEQGRLASGPGNVATGLGIYESFQLRQDLASKRYELAAASLQKAREDAAKQQLFVVRVVEPNLPGKSLYPKRGKIVLTVFMLLCLAYAIGWLIAAGVREHAS
jgi:capsular polysaccharide transport system permease protein